MKPGIPKGTRDFSSTQVARRNFIFNTIKHSFELFGFQPIETPSFENSSTLMGKYGEEGDRLIFKILNSGDYLNKVDENLDTSISFYITLTYVFKEVVKFELNLIKDITNGNKGGFISFEEFEGLKNDKSIHDFIINKIEEFTSLNVDDYDVKIAVLNTLRNEVSEIINITLNFIRNKGLDFKVKLEDERFVEWQLKWADRRIVKEFSKSILIKYDDVFPNSFKTVSSNELTKDISEKALRYDLTVPFARYVVQHQNEITFPFKRYQIQPVWRADKPQKGRYREFYQCDADVVGSQSLWQEVEFVQLYDAVFSKLNVQGTTIKINNRKILSGIAEVIGAKDKLIDFTVALDKLDKIGKDGVVAEMISKGISEEAIEKVQPLFDFTGSNDDKLNSLAEMLVGSEEGTKGVEELRFVIDNIKGLGLQTASLDLDVTLARGLNYYTGAIFEVSAPKEVKIGSIGGGGRYDDLTGIFGLKDVSGVGISFGLDRIYLVMEELGLFKDVELPKPKVLFLNFDENESLAKMKAINELRVNGVKAELYPDVATSNNQQKKQWKYVDKRGIEFVITTVEDEQFKFKNTQTREEKLLTIKEIINILQ